LQQQVLSSFTWTKVSKERDTGPVVVAADSLNTPSCATLSLANCTLTVPAAVGVMLPLNETIYMPFLFNWTVAGAEWTAVVPLAILILFKGIEPF